jgi:hypothetical protein
MRASSRITEGMMCILGAAIFQISNCLTTEQEYLTWHEQSDGDQSSCPARFQFIRQDFGMDFSRLLQRKEVTTFAVVFNI